MTPAKQADGLTFLLEVAVPYKALRDEYDGLAADGYEESFLRYVSGQPETAAEYARGWWMHSGVTINVVALSGSGRADSEKNE